MADFDRTIIERAICEIRYTPTLSYHTKNVSSICESFAAELPHWSITMSQLNLMDHREKNKAHKEILATNAKFWFRNRFPGVYDNFKAKAKKYSKRWLRELDIPNLTRIGVRVYYIIPARESFEDLRNDVYRAFGKEDLASYFSVQLSNFLVRFQFSSKKAKYNYMLSVLKPDEFPKNEPLPEGENLPKTSSVLLDIDRYVENHQLKELSFILDEAQQDIESMRDYSIKLMKG